MPFPRNWGETSHLLWRYRWVILCTSVVIGGAVTAWASQLPDRYRASALLVVRPQHFPEDYARLTMSAERAETLISVIREVLLSRSLLGRVMDEFHLYADLRATSTPEELVETMRRDIRVRLKSNEVFTIAYQGVDPQTAAAVTNRLAESFVDLLGSEVKTDPISHRVRFLEARFRELDKQRADLSRVYTASFPDVISIERQIQDVAQELDRERIRAGLQDPSGEGLPGATAGRAAQILDRALVPEKPSGPYRRLTALAGFLVGAGMGLAWALVRSLADVAFRDAADFETCTRVPVLGVVSRLVEPARLPRRLLRGILGVGSGVVTTVAVWYLAGNFQEVVRWAARWWKGAW